MADLDELAPNYRRVQRRWPSAPSLGRHYVAVADCLAAGGYGLVEHVKSFIESVCVTIIGEMGAPMPPLAPSATDLLVAALEPLGLRNTRGANKLDRVLSGFNRLADALTDMRNEAGPVAHGKDGFLDALTADHGRAFLAVGDAILGFLLNALEGKQPDLRVTREPWERFPHLNERIDRAVHVEARVDDDGERPLVVLALATGPGSDAMELRVEPSRLLYGIDREAYIELLKTSGQVVAETRVETEWPVAQARSARPSEASWAVAESGPRTMLVPAYSGWLASFRAGLGLFLAAEGLEPEGTDQEGRALVASLLATAEQNMGQDWMEREPIQARIKVGFKRVLVHFGLHADRADESAGRLIEKLREQVGREGAASAARAAAAREATK